MVKNQGTKQREQRTLGDCWQWKANGQSSKGHNCSFRHDINKRAKTTQPNPSPSSSTRQNERSASRTRSPRGRSPSGRMFRWPRKDYLKGICTNSFCENGILQYACSTNPRVDAYLGEKCSYAHRQVDEQPSKRSKKKGDKSAVAMLKKHQLHDRTEKPVVSREARHEPADLLCATRQIHDNWVASFRTWSRRSCHQFYGRAQTCRNESNV